MMSSTSSAPSGRASAFLCAIHWESLAVALCLAARRATACTGGGFRGGNAAMCVKHSNAPSPAPPAPPSPASAPHDSRTVMRASRPFVAFSGASPAPASLAPAATASACRCNTCAAAGCAKKQSSPAPTCCSTNKCSAAGSVISAGGGPSSSFNAPMLAADDARRSMCVENSSTRSRPTVRAVVYAPLGAVANHSLAVVATTRAVAA
mmetsp:Transcript_20807/g.49087  ORF Transcript_20807/g.49087 Transcript_20807/m.49087 type:complete len:207 (+) Transcript_20807:529-1149(+)